MEKPISKSTVFITGAARFHDLIYLIGRDKDLDVQHVGHSRLIGFDGGKFGHMGDRNWNAHAIAIAKQPTERLVIIGESGEVFTYAAGKSTSRQISPEPSAIRSAGVIDGYVYACGMKHEVYRRNSDDSWIAIPKPAQQTLADLEAIGGFGESEVYAAGWSGEVWLWDGISWSVVSALTNRILTSMCITDRGEVVICGQGGVMIRGRNQQWSKMDLGEYKDDIWDVAWYKDKLYFSTMTNLYCLSENGPEAVQFSDDKPNTFYHLSQAEGVLWSIGASDVFSFNGDNWSRID